MLSIHGGASDHRCRAVGAGGCGVFEGERDLRGCLLRDATASPPCGSSRPTTASASISPSPSANCRFCPSPKNSRNYPSKQQFVEYLEGYARKFEIKPFFNETVARAEYDSSIGMWRVRTVGEKGEEREWVSRWVGGATGENAEAVVPEIEGREEFGGRWCTPACTRVGKGLGGRGFW
ncbi:flavin-binding monooxygenase family protein [Actinidia rufa]|uniref:indole-3-pyruvate monooxygenase n=1 Tax=Actinidia rufa TaxID=165716 RepID=A0A7J0DQI3_9ERIC|nr:flavin-binding monooxygenase family protein [Actinidia rufa]